MSMEALRVVPIILAALRSCIGPKLTEKERQTTFMGLRPLCDPLEFQHADFTSTLVRALVSGDPARLGTSELLFLFRRSYVSDDFVVRFLFSFQILFFVVLLVR